MTGEHTFTPLWAGRLAEQPEAFTFQVSLSVDRRLALEDIQGSRAHTAMLAERGDYPGGYGAAPGHKRAVLKMALLAALENLPLIHRDPL